MRVYQFRHIRMQRVDCNAGARLLAPCGDRRDEVAEAVDLIQRRVVQEAGADGAAVLLEASASMAPSA